MSEANVLLQMAVEKARLIEEMITKFLGYKPTWKERKTFCILNRLGESSIYRKGEYIGTVTYPMTDDTIT